MERQIGSTRRECRNRSPDHFQVDALTKDEQRRIDQTYLSANDGRYRIGEIREELQRSMDAHVGVFRTKDGLEQMARQLPALRECLRQARLDDHSRTFNTELVSALELEFMLDGADAIVHSALAREESRGSHARRDFPDRNDEGFLAHTLAFQQAGRQPRLEYRPVHITQWQPQARTYSRRPTVRQLALLTSRCLQQ